MVHLKNMTSEGVQWKCLFLYVGSLEAYIFKLFLESEVKFSVASRTTGRKPGAYKGLR
jgi:hypothetical protein